LDEPAAGLDPRARIELRELLRTLASMGKSILISSHILTELSEMCQSVAIIEKGKIRATGSVSDVVRSVQARMQCFVRTLTAREEVERALREMPLVGGVRPDGVGLVFDFEGDETQLSELLVTLVGRGLRPVEFAQRGQNLEDLFMALTEGKVQ
jgi:ABC-2 type transport system ATP-binding protein